MHRVWSHRQKRLVIEIAMALGKDVKSYRDFDVPKSTFYEWKKAFKRNGSAGLVRKRPIALTHPRKLAPAVVERIIELMKTYHFGPERNLWTVQP